MSIIERPWSEDGWTPFRFGTEYSYTKSQGSNSGYSYTKSQGNNSGYSYTESQGNNIRYFVDSRSVFAPETEYKYNTSSQKSSTQGSPTRLQGRDSSKPQVCDKYSGMASGFDFLIDGVPKDFSVGYTICCDYCDSEMEEDMMCPHCKCKTPGWLEPTCCYICGEGHRAHSCPDKDKPLDPIDLDDVDEDVREYEEYEYQEYDDSCPSMQSP